MNPPPPYREHPSASLQTASIANTHECPQSSSSTSTSTTDRALLSTANNKDRKIWLCPHRGLTFNQAQKWFLAIPAVKSSTVERYAEACSQKGCYTDVRHSLDAIMRDDYKVTYTLNTVIPLLSAGVIPPVSETYERIFTLERVGRALHGLDIPLCPHIRLNHSLVLAAFNPRTLAGNARWPYYYIAQSLASLTLYCFHCKVKGISTFSNLYILEAAQRTCAALHLRLSRDLGSLDSPDDTTWLTNSLEPCEFDRVASTFGEWTRYMPLQRRNCLQETGNLGDTVSASAVDIRDRRIERKPERNRSERKVVSDEEAEIAQLKAQRKAVC
jgi:hypothetical protein